MFWIVLAILAMLAILVGMKVTLTLGPLTSAWLEAYRKYLLRKDPHLAGVYTDTIIVRLLLRQGMVAAWDNLPTDSVLPNLPSDIPATTCE